MKTIRRTLVFVGALLAMQLAPIVAGDLQAASATWCAYPTMYSIGINTQSSNTWFVEGTTDIENHCSKEVEGQLGVERKVCDWGCSYVNGEDTGNGFTGGTIDYSVTWKTSIACKSGTNRYRTHVTIADYWGNHIDDYYSDGIEWTCPSPPKSDVVGTVRSTG